MQGEGVKVIRQESFGCMVLSGTGGNACDVCKVKGNEMLAEKKDELEKLLGKVRRKKILFYYTDAERAAGYGLKMIKKIKWVFDFLESMADVETIWHIAAWQEYWKDHAGMEMRGAFDALYQRAVESEGMIAAPFREPQMFADIADAYYGDVSGHAMFFLLNDKPILFQNPDICGRPDIEKLPRIDFKSFMPYRNRIYFSSYSHNGLFQADLDTGKAKLMDCFAQEKLDQCLYGDCAQYEDKVVFVPELAEHIAIYDMESQTLETVELPPFKYVAEDKRKIKCKYRGAFAHAHFVYFIPDRSSVFLKLDMRSHEMVSLTGWYDELKAVMRYPGDIFFNGDYEIVEDKCYLPCCQGNMVLEIDLCGDVMKWHYLKADLPYLGTISYDGDRFWISGGARSIFRWDKDSGEIEEYRFPEGFCCRVDRFPFIRSIFMDGKVIFLPEAAEQMLIADTQTRKVYSWEAEGFLNSCDDVNGRCMRKSGQGLITSRQRDGMVLQYGLNGKLKKKGAILYTQEWREKYTSYFVRHGVYCEAYEADTDYRQLEFLLEYLDGFKKEEPYIIKGTETIGKKIWMESLAVLYNESRLEKKK